MKTRTRTTTRSRTAAAAIAALVLVGGFSFPLGAHDFWLVPDAFRIAVGEPLQVRGQTSDAFPSSDMASGPDRIASARLIGADHEVPLESFSQAGTSLLIQTRPASPAQRIIAVTLHPRSAVEVPADGGSGADWDSHWATLVFGIGSGLLAAGRASTRTTVSGENPDSAAVAATIDRFHSALAAGDSAAVADLLAPDAIILESGVVETREEYLGGHLQGDIEFARAVPRQRGQIRVVVAGDVAWATSMSEARGEFRGRQINSAGVELMVLRRAADGWRIEAIHWSSRPLRS